MKKIVFYISAFLAVLMIFGLWSGEVTVIQTIPFIGVLVAMYYDIFKNDRRLVDPIIALSIILFVMNVALQSGLDALYWVSLAGVYAIDRYKEKEQK